MNVFLDGIAVRFYRGIGEETQYVAPLSKMNFFIGANNSGKSILLNLLASHLGSVAKGNPPKALDGLEEHRGQESGRFFVALGNNTQSLLQKFLEANEYKLSMVNRRRYAHTNDQVAFIFEKLSHLDHIWVSPTTRNRVWNILHDVPAEDAETWDVNWQDIWSRLTGQGLGSFNQHWFPETISLIAKAAAPSIPEVHLIPAKRTLGLTGETFEDLSGRGLIDHLATLQNPAWDKQEDREKFKRITNFLRTVTGKPDATLEVPSGREHLLVHMDNKVLPLASLGTGIHEVILIASFCTIYDESMMCLEEPEIHLHPLLQRKLINYLIDNTSSQYFIATHSAAFVDTPDANVFHVTNDGQQTRVHPVVTGQDRTRILDDLGYQASDILQTNSVIWVEGPSDRIYLNHWISAVDDRLKEGIHYTIMFYGGGLISHLSASDDALREFIALRKLNRNMAIVLDSDKGAEEEALKPHAQRIKEEMSEGSGVVWVTAGREIENYIDGSELQSALKALHPRLYKKAGKTGIYDHAFYFYRKDPKNSERLVTFKSGDKVGAAAIICGKAARLEILDLKDRVSELAKMIQRANGI
ncbi:ATP-binding protein [Ferrimonas balearica]|nr:ATP-binding protein [Ferrimonas balearica]